MIDKTVKAAEVVANTLVDGWEWIHRYRKVIGLAWILVMVTRLTFQTLVW